MGAKEKLVKLITVGEQVKQDNIREGMGNNYISGEDYENWIAKCIILLESDSTLFNDTLVKKFIKASVNAVGNSESFYNTMIGILKAFNDEV